MAPPFSIAACRKPDARTSSMNLLTAASAPGRSIGTMMFCGTSNRLSGSRREPGVVFHQRRQALTVGPDGVDLARQQRLADLGRVVLEFDRRLPA